NQTITITVPISDESPIVEAYINHEGEDKFSFLTPEFQLNQKSGVFEATILIEPFAKTQFFTTTQLVVGDAYGNYSMFADLEASEWTEGDRVELSSIDFQVSNPGEDLIPPIADLTTVRIELDADNNPILLFNVSDVQSGVQFVSAVYQTTHEPQEVSGIIIDGEAQISLPIDNYLRSQTFILQSIIVVDNQNNRTDYERSDGLRAGDYEYTESDTLLVLALNEMMYFDKNQNGMFDSNEFPTSLHTGALYLENEANPDERYYFAYEGNVAEDNYTFIYTGNVLLADVPSGNYRLIFESAEIPNQVITPGFIEISGELGSQSMTISQRIGIYQAGTRVEITNGQIFSDNNVTGVFDEGDQYRLPIFEDDDGMKAMGMATYPEIFLVSPTGVNYGFAAIGKTGGNAYAYD
ncbi:MAG: hypothetical protein ACRC1D_06025, partial [Culicoidibacterales bacterium]